jgi:hypothetical protein
VPVVTAVVEGKPDFKLHDEVSRARCGALRLCQLCGKPMPDLMAFIGARESIERRTFGEPPAHRACLDFAFDACPFLAGKGYREGWRDAARAAGFAVLEPAKPPPEMGILITNGYYLVSDDEGLTGFKYKAAEPLHIEWRKRG